MKALNKNELINIVKESIELMPNNGIVYREILNKIGEKTGYNKIIELRGILYPLTSSQKLTISLKDNGELLNKPYKKFITLYTNEIKQTDLIYIENKFYKITDLGDGFNIYNDLLLEEVEGLEMVDGEVNENVY